MSQPQFEKNLSAAIHSGWKVVIAFFSVIVFYYSVYLWSMSARPQWLIARMGPGISWITYQNLCLWGLLILKMFFWVLVLILFWLVLWRRQIRQKN